MFIRLFNRFFKKKPVGNKFLERAKKMLVQDEGFKTELYKDTTGNLTIGIGYNIDGRGLPEDILYELLKRDILEAEKSAKKIFGKRYEEFSYLRKLGVVNMIFNLGESRFMKFKQTIEHIKRGRWFEAKEAAKKSLWAKQVGARAERVTDLFLNKITDYKFTEGE